MRPALVTFGALIGLASIHAFLIAGAITHGHSLTQTSLLIAGFAGLIVSSSLCRGPTLSEDCWRHSAKRLGWSARTTDLSWQTLRFLFGSTVVTMLVFIVAN